MMSGDSFSVASSIGGFGQEVQNTNPNPNPAAKKKRNLPGTPGKTYLYTLFLFSFLDIFFLGTLSLFFLDRSRC